MEHDKALRRAAFAAFLGAALLAPAGPARAETRPPVEPARPGAVQNFANFAVAFKELGARAGFDGIAGKFEPGKRPIFARLAARMEGNDLLWRAFFRNAVVAIGAVESPAPVMGFHDPVGDAVLIVGWRRIGNGRWTLERAALVAGAAFRDESAARPAGLPVTWLAETAKGGAPPDRHFEAAAAATARRFAALFPLNGTVAPGDAAFAEPDESLADRYRFLAAGLVEAATERPMLAAALGALETLVQRAGTSPFDVLAEPAALAAATALRDALPADTVPALEPAFALFDKETGAGFAVLSDPHVGRLVVFLYFDLRRERPVGQIAVVRIP